MALTIRPVRGEISQSTMQTGKSALRIAQDTGPKNTVSNIINDAGRQLIQFNRERDAILYKNKMIEWQGELSNFELKKAREITESEKEYTPEQWIEIEEGLKPELEKELKRFFKDDPTGANFGKAYLPVYKASILKELNSIRNTRIGNQTIISIEKQQEQLKKDFHKNFRNSGLKDDIGFKVPLISALEQLKPLIKSAVRSGRYTVEDELAQIQRTKDNFWTAYVTKEVNGEIDYEASLQRLKEKLPDGEDIPREQKKRLKEELTEGLEDKIKEEEALIINNDRPIKQKILDELTISYKNITYDEIRKEGAKLKGEDKKDFIDGAIKKKKIMEEQGVLLETSGTLDKQIRTLITTGQIETNQQAFLTDIEKQLNEELPPRLQYKPKSLVKRWNSEPYRKDENDQFLLDDKGNAIRDIQQISNDNYQYYEEQVTTRQTKKEAKILEQFNKFGKKINDLEYIMMWDDNAKNQKIMEVRNHFKQWVDERVKKGVPWQEIFNESGGPNSIYEYWMSNEGRSIYYMDDKEQMKYQDEAKWKALYESMEKNEAESSDDESDKKNKKKRPPLDAKSAEEIDRMLSE